MKNTPERLKALDNMVLAVKFFNEHISETGYQIERRVSTDNQYIDLRIRTPRDTSTPPIRRCTSKATGTAPAWCALELPPPGTATTA